MTRYIIIGAGAVGGGIGGRLATAGIATVLVARGEHLAALQRTGLRLRSPDDDVAVPVTAVGGPGELELTDDDVLVVTTKTHQAPAVLAEWADAPVVPADHESRAGTAGERLPVLMALNGVASEEMALRYFRRVFGVCVWMPAVHLEPGEVIVRAAPVAGVFHVGRVPATATEPGDHALLGRLQDDWGAGGLTVALPADVMPWKYRKLISNIANAIQALVGSNGDIDPVVAAAQTEARQVLDGAGIAYTSDEEEQATRADGPHVRPVAGEPAELGGSTWQSLTRATGNVESDYLNGEIARLAHRHQLDAPVNSAVASLARRAAAAGQRPGAVSAEQLAESLGL